MEFNKKASFLLKFNNIKLVFTKCCNRSIISFFEFSFINFNEIEAPSTKRFY